MTIFKGSGVAIVTPFNDDLTINYEELDRLIEFQIENKTDAIIIAGTTGEASTLSDEEHLQLIGHCIKTVNGRVPVVAGTGSNDTRHGINLSIEAEKLGADALLQVTPYYNKTTQKGLKEHFLAIANSVNIPIILYTVPGRTHMDIAPQTVLELTEHPNIVGLKDATGDLGYTVAVKALCGDKIDIYSGNDDIIVPLLSVGGIGVISVLANCAPLETHNLVHYYLDGKVKESAEIQLKYKRFIDSLFAEASPIPVKKSLELMGYNPGSLRLPLTDPSESTVELLKSTMKEVDLI